MILLDGKALFSKIKSELTLEVQNLCRKNLNPPHLSAILVGDNPASQTYVNAKIKACKEIGFQSSVFQYSKDVSQDVLIKKIQDINNYSIEVNTPNDNYNVHFKENLKRFTNKKTQKNEPKQKSVI